LEQEEKLRILAWINIIPQAASQLG
jgi:hypothetical protein